MLRSPLFRRQSQRDLSRFLAASYNRDPLGHVESKAQAAFSGRGLIMNPQDDKSLDEMGRYLRAGGKDRVLIHHPTDFTVVAESGEVKKKIAGSFPADVRPLRVGMSRVKAGNPEERERLMDRVRQEDVQFVAHHVYQLEDTREEIIITDRIYLTLPDDNPERLRAIVEQYKLDEVKRIGRTHVLKVTDQTEGNPLKVANKIARIGGVESCQPKILPIIRRSASIAPIPDQAALRNQHKLLDQQWHLSTDSITDDDKDVSRTASINAHEAWKAGNSFGSPHIVIAFIDDGFDLARSTLFVLDNHPAFLRKVIDPNRRNLAPETPADIEPLSRGQDIHGTPVAGLATASIHGDGILGVAPGCAFLPVRIGSDSIADLEIILEALEIASRFADVVNCSFSLPPSSVDIPAENRWFTERVIEMTRTGGKRGKGLVIVFAAGNDDAPIHLPAERNTNGVRFVQHTSNGGGVPAELKPKVEVHCGFAKIPGVVVVGAMTSLKRRAGYSNWGCHLTVSAPSNNGHEITRFLTGEDRKDFEAENGYPGRGLVTAVNRESLRCGMAFEPRFNGNPGIADFEDDLYTPSFGGTSGAAPLVTGVAALMLSANPNLKASEVIEILKETADKDLEMILDLPNDPNLKNFSGEFINGHSIFFGAGKVDAAAAVRRALKMKRLRARLSEAAKRTFKMVVAAVA